MESAGGTQCLSNLPTCITEPGVHILWESKIWSKVASSLLSVCTHYLHQNHFYISSCSFSLDLDQGVRVETSNSSFEINSNTTESLILPTYCPNVFEELHMVLEASLVKI